MAVDYTKLFQRMEEQHLSHIELVRKAGFSGNIMTRIRRGNYVSLESIEAICCALNCTVDEILEFKPDTAKEKRHA